MSVLRLFGAVLITYGFMGCANIVPPTGGPRDAEAPVLIEAIPPQGSTYFNSTKIKLSFDEYIKLQNPGNVRITPALTNRPVFTDRYNTLTIDLGEEVLEPNTTYTINFGDALVDLNENNKYQNLRYVFSTGSYLDSLSINGLVLDALKRDPFEKALVALYPIGEEDNLDSVIYLRKPFYFLKTDKTGTYSLENLRVGKYLLFAFEDKDNNLLYKNIEPVAFLDSVLVLDPADSVKKFDLMMFENTQLLLKVAERRSIEPGLIRLRFSSPIDSLSLSILGGEAQSALEWQLMGDSVYVFHQNLETDTLRFLCTYDGKMDTLVLANRKKGEKPLKTPYVSIKPGNQPSVLEPFKLVLSRPVLKVDSTLFRWKEDTVWQYSINFSSKIIGNEVWIYPELTENKRYELFLEKGALLDWFELPSDTFRFSFSSLSKASFGDLIFDGLDSIPPIYTHLQLMDDQFKLLQTISLRDKSKQAIRQLRPVSYRLRLLADTNGNGKWDGGDFPSRKSPELLWYYPEAVKLRANWEVEVNLSGASGK